MKEQSHVPKAGSNKVEQFMTLGYFVRVLLLSLLGCIECLSQNHACRIQKYYMLFLAYSYNIKKKKAGPERSLSPGHGV